MRCGWRALVLEMVVSFMGVAGAVWSLCLSLLLYFCNCCKWMIQGHITVCCQDSESLLGVIGIVRSQTQPPRSYPGCVQTTSG